MSALKDESNKNETLGQLKEPFSADDIEWRIGASGRSKTGFWALCLPYVNARAIMERLDSTVGIENWKPEYTVTEKGLLCGLSIRIDGEWICKQDGAEETDIEAFKGGISGALKRAGSVWSIGRYLYNLSPVYADISAEKKPGYTWAKSKDGEFYWRVPADALPAWALPNQKTIQQLANSPKPSPLNKTTAPIAPKQTRVQLASEIMKIAKELNLKVEDMKDWVDDLYKKSLETLTDHEMSLFLETLQGELGRKGV